MTTPLDDALRLTAEGFRVIDVPFGRKIPNRAGWQKQRWTADDLPQYFNGQPANIGVLCGEPSGGITDVDLDSPEAIDAGHALLPRTSRMSGRTSRPRSHYWYATDNPPNKAQTPFRDPARVARGDSDETAMLLEWRSTRGQTIVYGQHPSGEEYRWDERGAPAKVTAAELNIRVRYVAAAALLARYWPSKGGRHAAALAAAGLLLNCGVPADDTEAIIEAAADAGDDDETADRVTAAKTTATRHADGEEHTGGTTLAKLLGADGGLIVSAIQEWLAPTIDGAESGTPRRAQGFATGGPPEPMPEAEWPERPGPDAFRGLAGRVVAAIEPRSEADPMAILIGLLTAFGSAAGNGPYTMVGATRHPARLFSAIVGRSSKARKGDSWSPVRQILCGADPEWEKRLAGGLSSGEGLIWMVHDAIEKSTPIKEKGGRIVDYQQEVVDQGVEDKRLHVVEPELARVLKAMARQGNTLSPVIRDAYDSGTLRSMTKNSPGVATGAHITIIGHITLEELQRELSDSEAANGLGNRFLWALARRSKELPEPEPFDPIELAKLLTDTEAALDAARATGRMERDDAARALWREVYHDLSAERDGLAGALTARAEAQTLRLSMIYALLDGSSVITLDHLKAALEVWAYCEASVEYIFGDAVGDPVADTILRSLRANGEMTRTQISDLFGRHESTGRITTALAALLQKGLARSVQRTTGGRPIEVWSATTKGR